MKDTATATNLVIMCLKHSASVRRAIGARLGLDSLERSSSNGRKLRRSVLVFEDAAVVVRFGERARRNLCLQIKLASDHLEKTVDALWVVEDEHAETANVFAGELSTRDCGKVAVLGASELLATLDQLVGAETFAELRDALETQRVEATAGFDFTPPLNGVRLWLSAQRKSNRGVLARPAVVLTLSWKVVVEVCKKHRANGDVVVGSDENLDEPSILGASLARGKIGYEVCFSAATGKGRVDGGAPIGTLCRLFFGYQTARWNGSHHLDEPGGLIVEATLRFMESRQAKVACDALCADGGRILPDGWSNVLVQCEGRDVSISVRAYDVAAILATEGHPRHREAIAMAGTIDELSIALADAFARFGEECCAATCRLLEAMRTNGDNPRCG